MKTTIDELLAFAAVVDSGSITAAAEQLGLTISATSRTLSRLEEKLKTTLLRRTTRRLELTEEGAAFLEHARAILAMVDEAEEQMAARQMRPVGRLRVDAATPFMLHVIVPLVAGFRASYPEVELELNSNEGFIDLIEKRTDVAFRIGQLKDSTLHARPIGISQIRVLASPEYLKRHGTPTKPAQLAQHALLGFTQPESLNDWPLRDDAGGVVHIKPTIASSSGETLRSLALAGQGIVCLSDFMTLEDRQSGRLVQLFAKQTLDVRQPINAVYYRNTALASRITCFLDHVVRTLGKHPFER
ncbi:DNA-binding transcriptional LysR family regulator [Cupriavidus metallidurans]|jgi:DNA-binding transcriptional LysR family regulator|uniref:Transcriptional regulator, LysR family n=1 Tax=Cupriavidus metallidurans (strain ATCC 43123 / DSM 2839 / NBRC 102507 / CH34) TaxID=266264 RepID=Q1LCA2_CUPMC|nr:LysR family transcriptional regulator [Cupriavidus metallidurans]ABF12224.1 putative transcriptional regulator, LysR family [Cupriavidus metallidurans CH34]AVA35664.1 LysR family transcriptional regulator [Cupriavidus metallidurans]KWW35491.1 HTH-type transcriptional regulator DmlR [Cupriavidus metallidurans]MDE4921632.1 LysR family transcriptional regulator [Cupriavidus metallidurans]QGS32528.1 LysR family transcriptional regulator [Cupriavidus metallidurans]